MPVVPTMPLILTHEKIYGTGLHSKYENKSTLLTQWVWSISYKFTSKETNINFKNIQIFGHIYQR